MTWIDVAEPDLVQVLGRLNSINSDSIGLSRSPGDHTAMNIYITSTLAAAAAALTACQFPIPTDVCVASEATCADGMLTVCGADGRPGAPTACTFGCAPGGEGRCADLAPSNGLGMYLDQARAASPLVLTGDAIVDTDTGMVTVNGQMVDAQVATVPAAPVEILVVVASSVEANSVTVRGRRALAIISDGDIRLHGTVSLSAAREVPGPGGRIAADPACAAGRAPNGVTGWGGSGGGGHGSPGGRGGNGGDSVGGTAGSIAGNAQLVPLAGGCAGSFPFDDVAQLDPEWNHGGAGGGAIQISTRGTIHLDSGAMLVAPGAGAKGVTAAGYTCTDMAGRPPTCHPGAGGGAGGGILLEASSLDFRAASALLANGGAGHCGATGQATDGSTSASNARGTNCAALGGVGNGGNGAAGATAGFNGGDGAKNGGGGGGGAGRIRINLPPGAMLVPGGATISPTPSLGEAARR